MKQSLKSILYFIHRVLLRIKPYKKLIYACGWDSIRYKSYYRRLHFQSPEGIDPGEVDGYTGENDQQKIVALMENLFSEIQPPASVLDIGCGTGRYLKQMLSISPNSHFEGIDISKEIVEKFTRKLVPQVPIHVLDIETDQTFHLQNPGKFDLICMIGIIQILSLKRIRGILQKVNYLCSDKGYLYIQFNVETDQKKSSVGYKRYSIEELEELMRQCGFEPLKSSRTDILKDYAFIIAIKQ